MKFISSAKILTADTPARFEAAVEEAVRLLRRGEVAALPTETVYGLAANAWDPAAVERLFRIKGRPPTNPVIVHVTGLEMARECAAGWTEAAEKAAAAFWPGPLTLVLPCSERIPPIITASGATVGIRWPSHPLMQAVIRACGFPLAAPSANLSGDLSPTSARHVYKTLGDRIPLIVDGGQCQVGIESTVLDVSVVPPVVLRPGMIQAEELGAVVGGIGKARGGAGMILKSPGMLEKHYAPKAALLVWSWKDPEDLERRALADLGGLDRVCVIARARIPVSGGYRNVSVIPDDPEAFGRALYAELHRCDEMGARWIIVEAPPEISAWDGIRDRLRRGAAGSAEG